LFLRNVREKVWSGYFNRSQIADITNPAYARSGDLHPTLFCFHRFCITIFAFTVMGSTKPRGSNNFYAKLRADLLVVLVIVSHSLIIFVSESDCMSLSELHASPRIFAIVAACILCFCAPAILGG